MTVSVLKYSDATELQTAATAKLTALINNTVADRGSATVVLTGGSNGIGLLADLATPPAPIPWHKIFLFFGDERFVPKGHPDRNEGQAQEALFDKISIPSDNIFRMPASDDDYQSIDLAAQAYQDRLIEFGHGTFPIFDVHLFGMGEEGHVNSLFPHSAATIEKEKLVVAVTDSPKPPPQRITLTFPAIQSSKQTWLLVSGEKKAEAVAHAVAGDDYQEWPAAGARGSEKTLFFLDNSAASLLPPA